MNKELFERYKEKREELVEQMIIVEERVGDTKTEIDRGWIELDNRDLKAVQELKEKAFKLANQLSELETIAIQDKQVAEILVELTDNKMYLE